VIEFANASFSALSLNLLQQIRAGKISSFNELVMKLAVALGILCFFASVNEATVRSEDAAWLL